MTFQDLVKPRVLSQPVYEPGKPISQVAREFGLSPEEIIKLASNENPLGASPAALAAAADALREVRLYPEGGAVDLRARVARERGLSPESIIMGNGSNEIIEFLGHAFLGEGDETVMGCHAFIVYKLVTLLFGARPVEVPMPGLCHDLEAMRGAVNDRTRLVFLPSPNNPTGTAHTEDEILEFARSLPGHVIFVFDEAYAEYVENPPDLRPLIEEGRKVLCLRTFSKIYGLAGLRIGYGYGPEPLVGLLQQVRQPFNVNSVAQAAALAGLGDTAWVEHCRRENTEGLALLEAGFADMGVETVPSSANFLLIRLDSADTARLLFQGLQEQGIITRPVGGYGLPDCLRVSVGTDPQNRRVLVAAAALLGASPASARR